MQSTSVKRKLILKSLNKKIRQAKVNEKEKNESLDASSIESCSNFASGEMKEAARSISPSKFDDNSTIAEPLDVEQNISDSNEFEEPDIYSIEDRKTDLDYDSSSSSSSSSSDQDLRKLKKCENILGDNHFCPIIRKKLRQWAISFSIVQAVITALLIILKDVCPCLPMHGKNVTKTKNLFVVTPFCPEDSKDKSEWVYIGIENQLRRIVNPINHVEKKLILQFNIDGLPLFRSGGVEFWPILGKVHFFNDVYEPFIICVHKGIGKPAIITRYFKRFVNELNKLLEFGIVIDNECFTVEVMSFICDTPARSWIKNIAGHSGYYSCERCTQKGARSEGRTIFLTVSDPKRTDASFRNQDQPKHHNGPSPLLDINPWIDMIQHFSLDFMHLCCLGVMKRLLEYWTTNVVGTQLTKTNFMKLTLRLTNISTQIPTEFQRQMSQSLGLLSSWKATEFRFFLLYCGPLLMKDLLSQDKYEHFLLFHVSMRILCCKKWCMKYLNEVENFLKNFVLLCGRIYTPESLVINVHALIHLVDNVKFYKCSLSETTAFPFENALGKLKKLIHTGRKPLQQLCHRLSEKFSIDTEKVKIPHVFEVLSKKKGQSKKEDKIMSFRYQNFVFSTKKPDNCVLLKNGTFILVERIKGLKQEEIRLFGKKINILDNAFNYPTPSRDVNIHTVSVGEIMYDFFLSDIECKAIFLSVYELAEEKPNNYVISMLH